MHTTLPCVGPNDFKRHGGRVTAAELNLACRMDERGGGGSQRASPPRAFVKSGMELAVASPQQARELLRASWRNTNGRGARLLLSCPKGATREASLQWLGPPAHGALGVPCTVRSKPDGPVRDPWPPQGGLMIQIAFFFLFFPFTYCQELRRGFLSVRLLADEKA